MLEREGKKAPKSRPMRSVWDYETNTERKVPKNLTELEKDFLERLSKGHRVHDSIFDDIIDAHSTPTDRPPKIKTLRDLEKFGYVKSIAYSPSGMRVIPEITWKISNPGLRKLGLPSRSSRY